MFPTLTQTDLKALYEKLSKDPFWEDVTLPPIDLPEEDGIPLEDSWHRYQMNLLIDCLKTDKGGKENFFVGGNMFVYFMLDQVEKTGYKGPDFFYVKDVEPHYRGKWVVWLEGGKYPDVIIEFLSKSTRKADLTTKKELYETVFKTSEYYCIDPREPKVYGWHLVDGRYKEVEPDEKGYLESKELGYRLGLWRGAYLKEENLYLRFFNSNYELIPTHGELAESQAEQERQKAEQEKQRADKLEKELQELKKKLNER